MFNQPFGGYPWGPPNQPIVFVPSPGSGQTSPMPGMDVDSVSRQIASLEALKKLLKEEKKDEKKDDKKDKDGDPRIINMMLLMVLVSPITGPVMSHFFAWGLGMLPNIPH